MPEGPITHLTHAFLGLEERNYVVTTICGQTLLAGTNVVAVEVHQVNGSSSDMSFDLRLDGLTTLTPMVRISQPTNDERFGEGANVLLSAEASEVCGSIVSVAFYDGATLVGEDNEAPYQVTWSSPSLGEHTIIAMARDAAGRKATSLPVAVRVLVGEQVALVPFNATWQYLDDGSDQGVNWRSLAFDASSWKSGPAELGYGDDVDGRPEATVVSAGPDPENRFITTYFRHSFVASNLAFLPNLVMRVLRDDGVVVYLNGTELLRNNLPVTDPITYISPALAGLGIPAETELVQTCLSPSLLVEGTNVVAAEVHQSSGTSSDISFNLELVTGPAAIPELTISRDGGDVQICWPAWATCYGLEVKRAFTAAESWSPVTSAGTTAEGRTCVRLPIGDSTSFYRLKLQ
jgi:hypothetical protein